MQAKIVKTGCESTCKLMCSTNFPLALREKIKSEFYSLTDAQKENTLQEPKKVEHELKKKRVRNRTFVKNVRFLTRFFLFFLFS